MIDSFLPFGTFFGELGRMMLTLGIFLSVFLIAEAWYYFFKPPVEWTRKFVHFSCGIVIACFPWIFFSIWSVIALCALFGAIMLVARRWKLFPSIYSIQRSSLGDIYYLFSVLFLFLISKDRSVVYFISVLTLTVSDALAAILGSTYQRKLYSVENNYKSLEGSAVFFFSTFLIVHIPLLLLMKIDPLQSIMIALQVALIVTCLEAICINGFDNVMIPIGTYFLIVKLLPVTAENIIWQICWQVIIIVVLNYIAIKFQVLSISGAIVGQLVLYGAFIFGGPIWLIIPLMSMTVFMLVFAALNYPKTTLPQGHKVYQVVATCHVSLVPALLFFANNISEKYIHPEFWNRNQNFFYVYFLAAVLAHLVIALYRIIWLNSKSLHLKYLGMLALGALCFMAAAPIGLWLQTGFVAWHDLITVGLITFFASSIFYFSFKSYKIFHEFPWEFRIQSISVLAAVFLAFILNNFHSP